MLLPHDTGLPSLTITALYLGAFFSTYLIYRFLRGSKRPGPPPAASILRGPAAPSFALGNLPVVLGPSDIGQLEQWLDEYGSTFAVHSVFSVKEVFVSDPKCLSFIYNHPLEFQKPYSVSNLIKAIFGHGLLAAEGLHHRKQRKLMNPAFGVSQIRDLSPVVTRTVQDLKDVWKTMFESSDLPELEIDVMDWLSRAALNMIGEAGFGYQFNALHDSSNELSQAFHGLFSTLSSVDPFLLFTMFFPVFRHLPTARNRLFMRSAATMRRIGLEMVARKKVEAEQWEESDPHLLDKDLLSVLIRSNLKSEDSDDKLDDETLLAHIGTVLVAGHETVATAVSYCLAALARNPEVQTKLREDIMTCRSEMPSMDEVADLPYLDNVVKESLRLYPPVTSTPRISNDNKVVPLGRPVIDKNGKEMHEIVFRAGQGLFINIYACNINKELWGPDAMEFKPERFDDLPEAVHDIPQVFGNQATFNAGARGCIGWRLAILEFKTLLFTLVRTFDFDIDPKLVIGRQPFIAARPFVVGEESKGSRLPLHVSLHKTTVE